MYKFALEIFSFKSDFSIPIPYTVSLLLRKQENHSQENRFKTQLRDCNYAFENDHLSVDPH